MSDQPTAEPAGDPTPAPVVQTPSAPTDLRFTAPANTTGIYLSTGGFLAVGDDGVLVAPLDLPDPDRTALAATGFIPA